jgi:hypothetical protein
MNIRMISVQMLKYLDPSVALPAGRCYCRVSRSNERTVACSGRDLLVIKKELLGQYLIDAFTQGWAIYLSVSNNFEIVVKVTLESHC